MEKIIFADVIFLILSIYTGIFLRFSYGKYPDMKIGFHVREACLSKQTRDFANKFASFIVIVLSVVFFLIIFPLTLLLHLRRSFYIFLFLIMIAIYSALVILIVKFALRKKFNIKK